MIFNVRSLLYSGIVLLVVFFGLIILSDNGLLGLIRLRQEKKVLVDENHRFQKENQSMLREIERLKNDSGYVEALARKELGVVRKNELILKFKTNLNTPEDKGLKDNK